MKKITLIAASMLLAGTAFAADANGYWYIRGEFNGYNPDGNQEWALMDDDEGKAGVYTGTFTVPAGEFKFNLMNAEDQIFVPMDEDGYTTSENLDFSESLIYHGVSALATDDYEEMCYWMNSGWEGGQVTVTVDSNGNNPSVEIDVIPKQAVGSEDLYKIEGPTDGLITITWADYMVWPSGSGAYLQPTAGEKIDLYRKGTTTGDYQIWLNESDEEIPGHIYVDLNSLDLADGVYTLVIPEGYVDVVSEDYEYFESNPEITFTFEVGESSDPSYGYWYIRGEFNGYNPDGNQEWALMDDDEGKAGIYTGTFTVPAGEFKFNLLNGENRVFVPVDSDFDYTNVVVVFENNTFKGLAGLAWDDEEEVYYWSDPTWAGGMITVSVNANENNPSIEIYAFPAQVGGSDDLYTVAGPTDGLITITWADYMVWPTGGGAYLQSAAGEKIDLYRKGTTTGDYQIYLNEDEDAIPGHIYVDLNSLDLTDGDYTLVIPLGYVDVVSEDYEYWEANPEIRYEFTIGGSSDVPSAEVTVEPASGSSFKACPDDFTVAWDGQKLAFGPDANIDTWGSLNIPVYLNGEPFVENQYGDGVSQVYAFGDLSEDATSITFINTFGYNLDHQYTDGYELEFVIPAGDVLVGDNQTPCEEIRIVYTIKPEQTSGEAWITTATVVSPEGGDFLNYMPYSVELEWRVNDVAQEVSFVSDSHVVKVNLNGEEYEAEAELLVGNDSGIAPMAEGDDEENDASGTILTIDLYNVMESAGFPETGVIEIAIPADFVQDSMSISNQEQTVSFIVLASCPDSQVVVYPAPYSTYPPRMLSEVTVTFPDEITDLHSGQNITYSWTDMDTWEYFEEVYTGEVKIEGNTITLDLSFLESGNDYTVLIPSSYVMVGTDMVNTTVYIDYIVFDGMQDATVLNGPEEWGLVAQGFIPEIMLTWNFETVAPTGDSLGMQVITRDENWVQTITDVPASAITFATIEVPGDEPGTPEVGSTRASDAGNVLKVDLGSVVPADYTGVVSLVMPEGMVANVNGEVNPEFELSFYVYPYCDVDATFEIVDNVIEFSWQGYSVSSPDKDFFIVNSEGERTELTVAQGWWAPEGEIEINDSYTGFIFNVGEMDLTDGAYTLVIPGESVQLDDNDYNTYLNKEAYFEFIVKDGVVSADMPGSVESIGNANMIEGVYNINGVKVSNDLNSLSNGIYIINGKKVMIRK